MGKIKNEQTIWNENYYGRQKKATNWNDQGSIDVFKVIMTEKNIRSEHMERKFFIFFSRFVRPNNRLLIAYYTYYWKINFPSWNSVCVRKIFLLDFEENLGKLREKWKFNCFGNRKFVISNFFFLLFIGLQF